MKILSAILFILLLLSVICLKSISNKEDNIICARLKTGTEGEIINGYFVEGGNMRKITVDYEVIEC